MVNHTALGLASPATTSNLTVSSPLSSSLESNSGPKKILLVNQTSEVISLDDDKCGSSGKAKSNSIVII